MPGVLPQSHCQNPATKTQYSNIIYLFTNSFWGWFKSSHKQGFGVFTLQSSEMAQSQTCLQHHYRIFQEIQTSCNEHIVGTSLCWSVVWGVKYDQHTGFKHSRIFLCLKWKLAFTTVYRDLAYVQTWMETSTGRVLSPSCATNLLKHRRTNMTAPIHSVKVII